MIRRDYILRQLEQFAAMLAKIAGLARNEQWQEASTLTGGELQRLTGVEAGAMLQLSESALLARLIENEPMLTVESKVFMLAALLKTEGDLLTGQDRTNEAREFYLKGLHLLFEGTGRVEASERPDFAPTVEAFLFALRAALLPTATNVMLMRHHEQMGEFAKAEDALFEILEAEPGRPGLMEFGRSFYRRLLALSDDALVIGNLPRAEVESGLAELDERESHLG